MILRSSVDAWVGEAAPTTNRGPAVRLNLTGPGSSERQAFIWFPRRVPAGAKVLSAILRVRLRGAWAGTNTVTATRVTQAWREGTINWNNRPSVTTTNQVAVSVVGGADKQVVEFDVTALMQTVANGAAFYGFRLALTQNVLRALRSSEDPDASLRPELELEWSEAPEAPDRLSPEGGDAVSISKPLLDWRFTDKLGTGDGTQQASSQVQISTSTDFTAPEYDSGKVANTESQWDLAATAYAGVADGATRYWRVRVWDGDDNESEWSATAEFHRDSPGTLVIDSPGATVPETTPPVSWTLTGATQERYRVTLFRVESSGALTQLWTTMATSTDDAVTPASGHIVTGPTYRVRVEVWDDVDRVSDEHLTEEQDFTYVRDGTPDSPTDLTASLVAGSNAVLLTWQRSSMPDYFALRVDDVEVSDRIEPSDVFVSGTTYSMEYWGSTPRVEHTYEVEAVVQSGLGDPYLHSAPNTVVSATTRPVGIWLVDTDDDLAVRIAGDAPAEASIPESGATHIVIGSKRPVRITDAVRGYAGALSGLVLSIAERDDFLTLKERDKQLTLVLGDLVIPIRMEEASAIPTPTPGDVRFEVRFNFFQDGPPWPVG